MTISSSFFFLSVSLLYMVLGAEVVVGKSLPASALVSAVGYAASIILNQGDVVTLPSTTFVKGNSSVVVVNADEEVARAAIGAGAEVYGRYYNTVSSSSVSTMFRGGVTGPKPTAFPQNKSYQIPAVINGDQAVSLQIPDNQTYPTKRIVIFDKNANGNNKLSSEDAVKALLQYSESEKEMFVKSLVEQLEVHQIKNAKDISKFFG